MLTIVLGFKEFGNRAAPTVLYCGNDAGEAEGPSLNPPAGFVRTTLHKSPVAQRTRSFPENSEEVIAAKEATPEPFSEKPPAETETAPEPAAETETAPEPAAEETPELPTVPPAKGKSK